MELELQELEREQREKTEALRDSQELRSSDPLSGWKDDQNLQVEISSVDRQENEQQMRKSIDLKKKRNDSVPDESGISEAGTSNLLGPKNMQNPQGES